MTETDILERIKRVLAETFELDATRITMSTTLFEDLDLDSIDAVDLAIKLQEFTGKRIRPQEFKAIRTVGDVVVAVRELLA